MRTAGGSMDEYSCVQKFPYTHHDFFEQFIFQGGMVVLVLMTLKYKNWLH